VRVRITRKYAFISLAGLISVLLYLLATRFLDSSEDRFRIGMTFAEVKGQPGATYFGSNAPPPIWTNSVMTKGENDIGFLFRTQDGFSLYFDRNERLIAVYKKAWYYPLPLRRWFDLGPARPVLGRDIYRDDKDAK